MDIHIESFCSAPPMTPFAPWWNYYLGYSWINGIDFKILSKFILDKEKEIINNFPPHDDKLSCDGFTGLGSNSLTSRFNSYNLLNFKTKEIIILKKEISKAHKEFLKVLGVEIKEKIWIRCWANVLRDGQDIKPHLHAVHPHTYLGGHIAVQCNQSSTVYVNPINQINDPEILSIENEVGKITLFQNNIPHYSTVHKGVKERITIAFDLIWDNQFTDKTNLILLEDDEI